jgi:hypothetical protein
MYRLIRMSRIRTSGKRHEYESFISKLIYGSYLIIKRSSAIVLIHGAELINTPMFPLNAHTSFAMI